MLLSNGNKEKDLKNLLEKHLNLEEKLFLLFEDPKIKRKDVMKTLYEIIDLRKKSLSYLKKKDKYKEKRDFYFPGIEINDKLIKSYDKIKKEIDYIYKNINEEKVPTLNVSFFNTFISEFSKLIDSEKDSEKGKVEVKKDNSEKGVNFEKGEVNSEKGEVEIKKDIEVKEEKVEVEEKKNIEVKEEKVEVEEKKDIEVKEEKVEVEEKKNIEVKEEKVEVEEKKDIEVKGEKVEVEIEPSKENNISGKILILVDDDENVPLRFKNGKKTILTKRNFDLSSFTANELIEILKFLDVMISDNSYDYLRLEITKYISSISNISLIKNF